MFHASGLHSENGTKVINRQDVLGRTNDTQGSETSQRHLATNPQVGPHPISPSVPVLCQMAVCGYFGLCFHTVQRNNGPDLCVAP